MLLPHPKSIHSWMIALAVAVLLGTAPVAADTSLKYGLSMHGDEAFPEGPQGPFPWVNPEAPKGGALRLAVVGTFDSMNPYIILGVPAHGLDLVYQSLLYRSWDEPFTLYPQIASAVEIAEDRSRIVFHLDPRARFQDGTPVTADDVLFTFNALLSDGRPHTRTYFSGVTEAHRIGDLAVAFDLETGNWELPMLLGLMPVLSHSHFETVPFTQTSLEVPLGTGPYRVEEIDPGHRVVYRRDPDYWGADLPQNLGRYNFDTVEYTWYRDSNVAHQAFLSGDANIRLEGDSRRWTTGYDVPAVEDGRIVRASLANGRPSGLHAVVWNQRRQPFDDVRVREALGLAFDFDWINENLLHGQYRRTTSLFDNSDLAATGPASAGERELLAPWRSELPAELFERPYTEPGGDVRQRLRQAVALLGEAGFELSDGELVHAESGEPLTFELLLNNPEDERIFLAWFANLERLGVRPVLRTVDAAQHRNRITRFDFDALVWRWGVSLSPGNEQWIYWGSEAADDEGSRNYAGLRSPVLDSIISALSDARTADDLRTAARALDRVLMWGRNVLPLYHRTEDHVAYWTTLKRPPRSVLYGIDTWAWWHEPQ